MEAEGFLADDARVELEACGLKALAAARMAAVEDRHVVFLCHLVYSCEEADEVLFRVDVFFAVGAQKYVFSFLKAKAGVDVRVSDVLEVLVEDFRHRRT